MGELTRAGVKFIPTILVHRIFGYKRYSGDAKSICRAILSDCWNGQYLKTSSGHYNQIWIRDLGLLSAYLIKIGLRDRLEKTVRFIFKVFSKHKRTATTIFRGRHLVNIFDYAPDSLALLVRSAKLTNQKIIGEYRDFIKNEAEKLSRFLNKEGLLKKGYFSSSKDHYIRNSSTYDNTMVAMLASDLKELGIKTTLDSFDFKNIIKRHLWKDRFYDDLDKEDYTAGDANVVPYWSGVFKDRSMIRKSIEAIRRAKLDIPLPLKFTNFRNGLKELNISKSFAPNYQGNTVWSLWGLMYIDLVSKINKSLAVRYLTAYKRAIESCRGFVELFLPDGRPYKSLFYKADRGMLWAAGYLYLADKLGV